MLRDFQVSDWFVHPSLNTFERPDRTVRVEPKVMQVLLLLAEHSGEVVSKNTLLQNVWQDTFVTEDVLVRSISELRKIFEDDPRRGGPLKPFLGLSGDTGTLVRRDLRLSGGDPHHFHTTKSALCVPPVE